MGILSKLFGGKNKRLNYHNRFEIIHSAISGTMSKVYKAKDRQTGETVALKILDPKKTADFEARFKDPRFKNNPKPREGQIAIQFNHKYIVRTLEEGLTVDGEQYIVMEYLEGTGLNSVLMVKQDLLAGARLHYIRQVAEALQEVHEKGFIHRDICPRNLLFTGDANILKLTDFGLTVPNRPPFTDPGNRTGTPDYMAPELARRKPTDHRLDIFSFGVTIYELCTRQLPWPKGDSGLVAMTHDQPPEPITTYRPAINTALAAAIHTCIEGDPKKRFETIGQFLRAISKIQYEDD